MFQETTSTTDMSHHDEIIKRLHGMCPIHISCVQGGSVHKYSPNNSARLFIFIVSYRKIPKFLDVRNFAVIHLKFKQRPKLRVFRQNHANGIANSEDSDLGAV